MPRRQPFTALCQLATRGRNAGRADLHLHTTHSDGGYTPGDLADLARRLGLSAFAVTDHDTLAAIPAARAAAAGTAVEVVAGIEISAEYRDRELHLLGYFVRPDDPVLGAALDRLRRGRSERFAAMCSRLRAAGVTLPDSATTGAQAPDAWGRRHLAELLVRCGHVGSVREAFARYLHDGAPAAVPKVRLPVAAAVALVRGADGVAGWAHPPYDSTRESLAELRGLGMGAVEVDFPGVRHGRGLELRAWAADLGLAVTGGSDCHGPGPRGVGSHTMSAVELATLRQMV